MLALALLAAGCSSAPRPAGYFEFACEPIAPERVNELAGLYPQGLVVGIDANSEAEATLAAARRSGARLHVYLEGPGGPTGESWTPDELERIQAAARAQGIDTGRKDWMTRWEQRGWKSYTLEQLKRYRSQGFESAEIDNLYRNPQSLVDFYREYADWWRQGLVPRAMLKNVSLEDMQALSAAIGSGEIPRAMFSDFAIFESSAGDPSEPVRLAAELGIKTMISQDTYDYRASGAFP